MSIAVYQLGAETNKLCIVVGLGLIGGEISNQLALHTKRINFKQKHAIDWSNSSSLIKQIQVVIADSNTKHLEIIWAAGKAGFSASETEISLEYNFYSNVISTLKDNDNLELTISLLSSAGGIYENSSFVTTINEKSPSRPYSHGKLKQEELLYNNHVAHRIYRISTVYGFGGTRFGLINTMLHSAHNRKPMMIYANQNTVRDYIYSLDVAKNIVTDVIENTWFGTKILASGRATSINMLLNLVKNITKKNVAASFHPDNTNDKNIVFSKHLAHTNISPTSLEEGLRLLDMKIRLSR